MTGQSDWQTFCEMMAKAGYGYNELYSAFITGQGDWSFYPDSGMLVGPSVNGERKRWDVGTWQEWLAKGQTPPPF